MEENSESHMETDVSSTTDDVPESQQITGYHGDVEMVIVVEKLKEDEVDSIDSKFEQQGETVSSATVTKTSPQKDGSQKVVASQKIVGTPQKIIVTPFKETNGPKSLVKTPIKSDSRVNMDVPQPNTTQTEHVDSSTKSDTIMISPSKTTDTNCIQISPIQVNHKSPFKSIKLVRNHPNAVPKLPDKPIIIKEASLPNVIKVTEVKEANLNTEQSTKINQSTPKKDVNVQEKSINPSKESPKEQDSKESSKQGKQLKVSPIKIDSCQEKNTGKVENIENKAQDTIKITKNTVSTNSNKTVNAKGSIPENDNSKTVKSIITSNEVTNAKNTSASNNIVNTTITSADESMKAAKNINASNDTVKTTKNINASNDNLKTTKVITASNATVMTGKIINASNETVTPGKNNNASKETVRTARNIAVSSDIKTTKIITASNDTVKATKNVTVSSDTVKTAINVTVSDNTVKTAKNIVNETIKEAKSSDNESTKRAKADNDVSMTKTSTTSPEVLEVIEKDPLDVSQDTEAPEKEHNKSISRELKSLINSAKESKIISECTQLTSKTRKSRSHVDSPNTSLIEGDKVENRRGSTNSQISTCSEKSDKPPLKRSMRSQNPEFVSKCKQFLNSVASKVMKEDDNMSEDESETKGREKADHADTPTPKKKKVSEQPVQEKMGKLRSDAYCWRCHWTVEQTGNDKAHPPLHCTVCPRSYHYKCLSTNERRTTTETTKSWVCPDCLLILSAESSETRSPAMKKTSLGTLCVLLKHALDRMMELHGAEPFIHPVDRTSFPDYDKYIVHPMDLTQMKNNIEESHYGSTEAFVADVQWILHNSIIFNTCEQAFLQSKLSAGARALVRSCKAEMGEIEACPECYAAAHAHKPTWFTDVCTMPHILLWAKLKGFPYWPAKGMTVNSSGLVDVRFFGAHDRAWVPAKDCFLFSEKDPNNFRNKRQDILDSMMEAEHHIRNISRKYGKFVYPPFKTQFEPTQLTEQLKMMIPTFEGEVRMKEKPSAGSPVINKETRRSNSKSSKSSANEGDDETDDTSSKEIQKSDKENGSDKNKPMEVDTSPQLEAIPTRKRRRSNLEEAVLTIMNTPEKKKKTDNTDKKSEPQHTSNKVEITSKKELETKDSKKKTDTPKAKSKDEEPSSSTLEDKESQRVTPIKLVALPRTNKQTPKMFATKASPKPSTPKDDEKTPQQKKITRSDKTPNSEKGKDVKAKDQLERSRTSRSKSANSTPKSAKQTEKKAETNEASSSKEGKTKENKRKNSKEIEAQKTEGNKQTVEISKPMKDRINFDDDTTLASIARKTRNSGLPTITNVCSLSTMAQASTTDTQTTAKAMEVTIEANSDSSIFTPTSTDNVRNMQDAVSKLQKLRDTEPLVGRVGVKAFARMTSPPRTDDNVQVEIKAEPIDLEEADVERHNEKMDLMNACKLRPVSQTPNLRDVRINRVVVPSVAVKKPESRPRAKKTFPQPRRVEENRSELNGKNSMVYIPIQPPITPVPVRGPRPAQQAVRPTAPTPGNKIVNTITTPLKTITSTITSPSVIPPISTVTSGQVVVPTVGQGPTVGQVPTTVHTLPLMTSVNGQWMFSLQPVMSVGGVDGTSSGGIVNGISERGSTPALVPLGTPLCTPSTPSTPTNSRTSTSSSSTPSELPRLQQRPLVHPLDASATMPPPSTAGTLTAKLNQNAVKLADFFRTLIEDTIERFDDPAAVATSIRLQLEHLKWRHQHELDEIKHNHELSIAEMRLTFEKEKVRAVTEARRASQVDLEAAVKLVKSKQWCANCAQEAQFYCCWNTSYCDYPCQRAHWPVHYTVCAQANKERNEDGSTSPSESRWPQPDSLPSLQKSAPPPTTTQAASDKTPARLAPAPDAASTHPQKTSIIVSMVEDNSGNQTMKCVGTYKSNQNQAQMSPLILNKQVITDESGKKVVTSGGYLIVGATSNASSIATPASTRRSHNIQYFT